MEISDQETSNEQKNFHQRNKNRSRIIHDQLVQFRQLVSSQRNNDQRQELNIDSEREVQRGSLKEQRAKLAENRLRNPPTLRRVHVDDQIRVWHLQALHPKDQTGGLGGCRSNNREQYLFHFNREKSRRFQRQTMHWRRVVIAGGVVNLISSWAPWEEEENLGFVRFQLAARMELIFIFLFFFSFF